MSKRTTRTSNGAPTTHETATGSTAVALPTITRAQANELIKTRAVELFHLAKAKQQEGIGRFEAEYGRADRIDPSLLKELQHLQMRFAGIGARQQRQGYIQEPKVNKFVKALGEIIGDVTVHLATENALELFAPVDERDYIGYSGTVGSKGYDDSLLTNYRIVDEPRAVVQREDLISEQAESDTVCLHENIEPLEDQPGIGACTDCGDEFVLPADDTTVEVGAGDADGRTTTA